MNVYISFGMWLGLAMFLPQVRAVMKGKSQNLASWLLWWIIAIISSTSIIVQKGNYALPLAYCVGDWAVVCMIVGDWKSVRWTRVETFTSFLVVCCIVAWYWSGPKAATVMATVAHITAGIPQLRDTYKYPENTSALVYLGFSVASFLSAMGGRDWSVEQSLYQVSTGVYCMSVSLTAMRKVWSPTNRKNERP